MASGENQGLLVSTIVFATLTILLGALLFVTFRSYQETAENLKKSVEDATNKTNSLNSAQTEMNEMKEMMGLEPSLSFADVKARFAEDKAKYAATLPEAKQHYRQALEEHALTLAKTSGELIAAKDQIKQLMVTNENREKAKQPQIDQHDKRAGDAIAELGTEKTKFTEDRTKFETTSAEMLNKTKAQDDAFAELQTTSKKEKDQLTSELTDVAKKLESRNETIKELEGEGFEVPDGQIRWVNADTQVVWINLGKADQLRRQTSFSVYDPDVNTSAGAEPKGSIEVTHVLKEHLAVARIVDDDIKNPIVPGDKIYTPLWQPGRGEHFAIMGKVDLDGDGKDDRDVVKDMITMAGGEIDAELDAKGQIVGPGMNKSTRYLLSGDFADADRDVVKGSKTMETEARRWGVRELDVTKFLDLVGWKDPKQVLRFGRGGNAERQLPDRPDGGWPTTPSYLDEQFKKRRPPAANGASAYGKMEEKEKAAPAKTAPPAKAAEPAADAKQ